jgi:hypothetical protein
MLRLLPILAIAMATPTAAATLDCMDPAGDLNYLEIVETYDEATGVYGLVSARFKIMDELGYTSAKDPSNDGDVTFVNVKQDTENLNFDMHLLNVEKGYDTIVGSVRLYRAYEGSQIGIGGTLHAGGGGAFGVACTERAP